MEPDEEYVVEVVALAQDPDYNSAPGEVVATTELWFNGGDGSAENPWQIGKASQLLLMARLVNGEGVEPGTEHQYPAQSYILTRDIDMSGVDAWVPIATGEGNDMIQQPENNVFRGEFNGGSHSIKGLEIAAMGEGTVVSALFGAVSGGYIHDLELEANVKAEGLVAIAAGLAGVVDGATSKIENCTFSGIVSAISTDDTATAAGLLGLHMAGEVKGCRVMVRADQSIVARGRAADAGGVSGYGNTGSVDGTEVEVYGRIEALSESAELLAGGQSSGAGGLSGSSFGTLLSDCKVVVEGSILSRAIRPEGAESAATTASAGGMTGHYAADLLQGATVEISGSIKAEATDLAYSGGIVGQQARNGYSASGLTVKIERGGLVRANALDPLTGNTGAYAGGMYGIVSFQTATGTVANGTATIDGTVHAASANSAMAAAGGIAASSGSVSMSSVTVSREGLLKAENTQNASVGGITGILAAGSLKGCDAVIDGTIESPVNGGGLVGAASGTRFTKKNINGSYAIINGQIGAGDNADASPSIGGIAGMSNSYAPVRGCYWYAAADSGVEGISGSMGASDDGRLAQASRAELEAAAEDMNSYLGDYVWVWDESAGRLVIAPAPIE